MGKTVLQKVKKTTPRMNEEMKEAIAYYVRFYTWTILAAKLVPIIRFNDLFEKVTERIRKKLDDPDFKLRRDYFITSLMVLGSNIAIISDGAELWVTYAHRIRIKQAYIDYYQVILGRGKAAVMRQTARNELQSVACKTLNEIKRILMEKQSYQLRLQSLLFLKGYFVLWSEKEAIYITTVNRIDLFRQAA